MTENTKRFCIRGADTWLRYAGLPTYAELTARIAELEEESRTRATPAPSCCTGNCNQGRNCPTRQAGKR